MTALLVVAKAPVPGAVKTRLCPPATPREAAEIAAAALLDTLDVVGSTPGVVPVLAYAGRLADAVRAAELQAALAGWRLLPQRGGNLADRLANAHADTAELLPGQPVVQIGMDTPQVRPDQLTAAADRLTGTDAVLGPAADGGWWLLGLRDPAWAAALRTVPMSTTGTCRLTRAALLARGLRLAELPVLIDVDTWPDATTVAGAGPDGRYAATVWAVAGRLRAPGSARAGTDPAPLPTVAPARGVPAGGVPAGGVPAGGVPGGGVPAGGVSGGGVPR